jgi:hypothetical protein
MPEKVVKFQRVSSDFGIVTDDFGNVTGDFGRGPKIGHDETKRAVTFARNRRSRSNEMGGHDGPKYASQRPLG